MNAKVAMTGLKPAKVKTKLHDSRGDASPSTLKMPRNSHRALMPCGRSWFPSSSSSPTGLPPAFLRACRERGVRLTRFVFVVKIGTQSAALFEQACFALNGETHTRNGDGRAGIFPGYQLRGRYRCSTSKFGIGQVAGSNCTPLGLHRVAEKIGGGWPVGAVFRSRRLVGFTWQGLPLAPITNRIFWLEGLEPGFNHGGNVDTYARYIYIHGTGDEPTLGQPASHGCIHLSAQDLLPLYDRLPVGSLVWTMR
jgi:L,D-transpeptidase catalytic domain